MLPIMDKKYHDLEIYQEQKNAKCQNTGILYQFVLLIYIFEHQHYVQKNLDFLKKSQDI